MADAPIRALVLEDDPDAAQFLRIALEQHGGMRVSVASTAEMALVALGHQQFDVLVTDIQLPGYSGLEILPAVRQLDPTLAVLVVTAYPTFDHALEALRGAADDFLVKPVVATDVVRRATELAERTSKRRAVDRHRVLAVGAHPDDVEIGVGGTLAAHASAGDEVVILTLSGGAVGGSLSERQAEARAAAAVVRARLIHRDFPDTRLVPAEGVITAIEEVVAELRPDRIYTHGAHDRHQDHRAVHESVQIAARQVPNVWCFQSPSSTVEFAPNRFVDIAPFLEQKLTMLGAYESQAHRDYMDPEQVRATARYWSRFSPAAAVEPLETVRASESVGASASVPVLASAATSTEERRMGPEHGAAD